MPHSPSMFQVFRSWRQWEEMGAGKTDHTCIFACLSLTHHPCCLRAWNRLHSSKIHKTLIMQKCPNRQRELKYQEFLHPEGKKLNTHPCTTISYALSPWEKNLFVILEGIAVVGLMKSDVFILSYHLKRSGIVFNNQYELIIV